MPPPMSPPSFQRLICVFGLTIHNEFSNIFFLQQIHWEAVQAPSLDSPVHSAFIAMALKTLLNLSCLLAQLFAPRVRQLALQTMKEKNLGWQSRYGH